MLDPMEAGDLMNEAELMGVCGGNVVNMGAREAIAQAIRRTPSGQEGNVLVAGLALRLAELGYARDVRVTVAGGEDAALACSRYWPRWKPGLRRPRAPQNATKRARMGQRGRPGVRGRFPKRA